MQITNRIKLALVCTSGGHFEQMTNLRDLYNSYDHFWITNRSKQTESLYSSAKVYYIKAAHYKEPWTYLCQVPLVLKIFRLEKPTHVLSTGSGRTAFIPYLFARLLKIEFIHIDTYSRVKGYSKFGAFVLKTGNRIYKQWPDSGNSKVIYIGPIFRPEQPRAKRAAPNYVFVTVGTRSEPFTRLLQSVENLIHKGVIKEKVIVQGGTTLYPSRSMEIFNYCTPQEMEDYVANASFVITQESAGVGTLCLKAGTRFIVMPREYEYGELPAKSDMKEDLHFKLEEMGYTKVVRNTEQLEEAIKKLDELKVGFKFDNTYAIQILRQIIEGSNH